MADLDKALDYTFAEEGGFSNHPDDHGGKTNYGITETEWTAAIHAGIVPNKPIEQAEREECKAIYQKHYWYPWSTIENNRIAAKLFDAGVNCGVGSAVRIAVRSLNMYGFNHVVTTMWDEDYTHEIDSVHVDKFLDCIAVQMEIKYYKIVMEDIMNKAINWGWSKEDVGNAMIFLNNKKEDDLWLLRKKIKTEGLVVGQLSFLKGWLKRARRLPDA